MVATPILNLNKYFKIKFLIAHRDPGCDMPLQSCFCDFINMHHSVMFLRFINMCLFWPCFCDFINMHHSVMFLRFINMHLFWPCFCDSLTCASSAIFLLFINMHLSDMLSQVINIRLLGHVFAISLTCTFRSCFCYSLTHDSSTMFLWFH